MATSTEIFNNKAEKASDEAQIAVSEETDEQQKENSSPKNGLRKGSDFIKKATQKTGETGKKVFGNMKSTVQNLSEQKRTKDYELRLKKYNPLFKEMYEKESFNIPNLLTIVDDAVRKDVDVCQGAIGWLSTQKGVEVMHLYDEAIAYSGLTFIPAPICDCAYYVDPHNKNHFISVDTFFNYLQEEKLAELQHIAFSLGAKSYTVEMVEISEDILTEKGSIALRAKKPKASSEINIDKTVVTKSKSLAKATFAGNKKPEKPNLNWFANDKNVLNLVDMRCSENVDNAISEYSIELSTSNTTSISAATATKIDGAIKKMGLTSNFDRKSKEEHHQKMVYSLIF